MSNESLESQLQLLGDKLAESVEHKRKEAKFAEEATIRFETNLTCFKKYYPEVANALEEFQAREGFCLHVTKTGHGNIVPNGHQVLLYSEDPILQTHEQVSESFESPFITLSDYSNYSVPKDSRIHMRYMTKLSSVIKEHEEENQEVLKSITDVFPSAIIFGIGLGYHIPMILEKAQFKNLFIVEPDFELFYASLFCIDWAEIIERQDEEGHSLYLLLGADENTFITDLEEIVERVGAFTLVRSFCYQHTADESTKKLISQWINNYFLFQNGHGFFNDSITGFAHSIHMVEKNVSFLTSNKSEKINLDTPVFIVGNGPSLDEAEAFIRANHNNAIVIAAGTAVASLYKKDIPADFHVLIERPYANYKIFGDILPEGGYKGLNLLGVNTLYPDTVDRYQWAGIAVKGNESGTDLLQILSRSSIAQTLPMIPFCNPVVANTALSYAMYLGFKNIFLFGVDNGKSLTGEHHSSDSIYKKDNNSDDAGYPSAVIRGRVLPGNLSKQVESNNLFASANHQLEKLIALYPERNIFNVGNGAKIKGAIPTPACDLLPLPPILDKRNEVDSFKESFQPLGIREVSKSSLGLKAFDEITEHLLKIVSEPISSRVEALEQLTRQERFLYTYQTTPMSHLFHILKGAMLYYHCPMITMLYKYDCEQYTVSLFRKLNSLWADYIMEMRAYFPENYKTKCDHGSELFD